MAEQEKKPAVATQKKNYRFGNRTGQSGSKSTYKSKVVGLEEDTFDVRASSNPAKFSKLLKSIENYIQRTYKMPDDSEGDPTDEAPGIIIPKQTRYN